MGGGSVRRTVTSPRVRLALSLTFTSLLATSAAAADPVTRASVEASLSGFEGEPDVAAVRRWGADGERALLQIARDATLQGVVRVRAFHALRALAPDAGVHRLLRDTAAAPSADLFVRRACFDALVEGFDDVAEVARHLADPAPEVRDGAAWTLSRSTNAAARSALRARLAVETDPTVRITLAQAVRAPEVAPPVVTTPMAQSSLVVTAAPRRVAARTSRRR
jgi:hypothetical protein